MRMNKEEMRACMRAKRRALSKEAQEAASQAVLKRLTEFEPYQRANTVMAYMACRGELSLEKVILDALWAGKTLLLPRCEAPGIMTARRIHGMEDLLPGRYGLLEPKEACPIMDPQEMNLVLVPGVAFDRAGNRLGQGGGYYDRFLQGSRALRAGICHESALLEYVPHEAHDIVMDNVITPGETIRICNRRI